MAKELKIWNGHLSSGLFKRHNVYVAAYSAKQACELLTEHCKSHISSYELKNYFHKGSWGNSMDGIIPTEPCVYAQKEYKEPFLVFAENSQN